VAQNLLVLQLESSCVARADVLADWLLYVSATFHTDRASLWYNL